MSPYDDRPLEKAVQAGILNNLRKIPDSQWDKSTITNKKGREDIWGHIQGYFLAIEVKRKNEKPTPIQEYRIAETNRKKGFSVWVDSWKSLLPHLQRFAESKGIRIPGIY